MKKLILFSTLIFIALFTQAQENLIKDGSFENVSFSVNDMIRKLPEKGIWYPYLTSDQQAVLSIKKDKRGNVASIQTLSNVSYAYSFIGQRIANDPSAGIYTLSFFAKATSDIPTYISAYLRIKTTPQEFLFFPINKFDPKVTPTSSGALKQIRLTSEWVQYSVDFDLNNTINGVAAPKNAKNEIALTKASNSDRKDFYLAFSCLTKNAGLVFTDVTFTKKE